jgi:hypothetical protein
VIVSFNLPLAVTLWRRFSQGRRDAHTWRSFVDTFVKDPEIVRDKKKVAGFSLATFEDDKRALSRVEQVFALVLDLDHGSPSVKAIAKAFRRTIGVAYTTHSHEPSAPRFRAIFPHSRPITADEHDRVWAWAKRKCEGAGLMLDAAARDASRLFFLPSHRPGAEYYFQELAGRPIDVDGVLKQKWVRELTADDLRLVVTHPHAVPCPGPHVQGTATRVVDTSASGRDFNLTLRRMREGKTDDEILDELREASVKYAKRGEAYIAYTVERARQIHETHAPVMRVRKATLHCRPPRFSYGERRHIELELVSEDGELAKAEIVVPAAWHSAAAFVTWRACFPDIEPESLLGRWEKTQAVWAQLRWRRRLFEIAARDGHVRWIRSAGTADEIRIPVDIR